MHIVTVFFQDNLSFPPPTAAVGKLKKKTLMSNILRKPVFGVYENVIHEHNSSASMIDQH